MPERKHLFPIFYPAPQQYATVQTGRDEKAREMGFGKFIRQSIKFLSKLIIIVLVVNVSQYHASQALVVILSDKKLVRHHIHALMRLASHSECRESCWLSLSFDGKKSHLSIPVNHQPIVIPIHFYVIHSLRTFLMSRL